MPKEDNYENEIAQRIEKIQAVSFQQGRKTEHMFYEKGFEDGMRYFRDMIFKPAMGQARTTSATEK